jgi:hypothetical protein
MQKQVDDLFGRQRRLVWSDGLDDATEGHADERVREDSSGKP